MQCASTIFSSVACMTLPYFVHYVMNGTIFEKKVTGHKMRVLIFPATLF